jgi:hypothetical protein
MKYILHFESPGELNLTKLATALSEQSFTVIKLQRDEGFSIKF